jgi:hypothetical protein
MARKPSVSGEIEKRAQIRAEDPGKKWKNVDIGAMLRENKVGCGMALQAAGMMRIGRTIDEWHRLRFPRTGGQSMEMVRMR